MTVNPDWIKEKIDFVREEIGRNVTFSVTANEACVLCVASGYYDTVNDTTFYFTCPVCDGNYYMSTQTETEVLARIHWVSDEQITATPGGKYFAGDCYIHIEPTYRQLAESAQNERGKVVVDGHDMQIDKIIPQGAPTINRYRLILRNMGSRPE